MSRKSKKLTKWDEVWLSDKNEEKYDYAIGYIRTRWPLEVAQRVDPAWSISNKQDYVRKLFLRLLQESQFDAGGIIRRTKEAWRSFEKNSLKRNSGNYTYVKLTESDKNKMRKLAKEAELSSVTDVVSSILSNEHKAILAAKKIERVEAAKNTTAIKDKAMLSGLFINHKLKKLKKENHELRQELEFYQQKMVALTDMFSQQLVTLERYESDGIAPLTDEELEQAQEMAKDMMKSFEK